MTKTSKSLEEIFEAMPTTTSLTFGKFEGTGEQDEGGLDIPKRVVACFSFSKADYGFGDITVVRGEDGQTYIDSERSSKDTVLEIFAALIKDAIFDWEKDPEKHKQYHKVMGGSCNLCADWDPPKNPVHRDESQDET